MPFEKVREVLKKMCERHKNLTVIYGWKFVPHFPDFFYAAALKNILQIAQTLKISSRDV